ncbi:hypothetical protein M2105_006559 [Paenibacillus sp. PastF-1]|nr:hypothetical protein [Paenibacillus sp. PastF-2]MDF9852056.1 hypothetical protein [Paenibacillus sp. PastM-2]MDF9858631.1 hypothetical protein [Paenibacillus sp. PastF-1]MDH6483897.1 hypothetical protein [Paenibacillus sp. PastH-2]MDH6511266.1 hypothetical protein [Paenibacillus sp. PastM-3]
MHQQGPTNNIVYNIYSNSSAASVNIETTVKPDAYSNVLKNQTVIYSKMDPRFSLNQTTSCT